MKNKISWLAASALVIAYMVGTGVFASLGFQIAQVKNSWSILILWGLGALMALSGAFTYADLGKNSGAREGNTIFYRSPTILLWDIYRDGLP